MWKPTHVQITVLRAKNLLRKGKGGTNNSFVTIQLGKDKFQTSIQENTEEPEWEEECDLSYREELQEGGAILLTVFHRNFFGLDEFLGQLSLPLAHFGVYDTPKSKWYRLRGKAGKKEEKERGELEVRLAYVVRDNSATAETPSDSARIKKLSGSLLDIASNVGHKIQKLPTRSLSLKLDRLDPRLRLDRIRHRRLSVNEELSSLSLAATPTTGPAQISLEPGGQDAPKDTPQRPRSLRLRSSSLSRLQEPRSFNSPRDIESPFVDQDLPSITESPLKQNINNKNLNNLNNANRLRPNKNSNSFTKLTTLVESSLRRTISVPDAADLSLAIRTGRTFAEPPNNWEQVCITNSLTSPMTPDTKPIPKERRRSRLRKLRNGSRRHTIQELDLPDYLGEEGDTLSGGEESFCSLSQDNNRLDNMDSFQRYSGDILDQYERMNHTELLELLLTQQELLQSQESKIRDLELYIDNLLLRVMETTPRILQNPYKPLDPAFYR